MYKPVNVVENFGADPTGNKDSTVAIQNALDTGRDVYIPGGTYLISSTLNLTANFQSVRGDGDFTHLKATITDGSAAINITYEHTVLENLRVWHTTLAAANFIGVASDGANRWYMNNVYVRYATIGFNLTDAWIGTAHNLWAHTCDLGLRGTFLNNVDISIHMERCLQPMDIDTAGALRLDYMHEGPDPLTTPSEIDGARGVIFTSCYIEYTNPPSVPEFKIGHNSACTDVSFLGTTISVGPATDYIFDLDQVRGFTFNGRFASNTSRKFIKTTSNTLGLQIDGFGETNRTFMMPANSSLHAPIYNYFPDPYMKFGIPEEGLSPAATGSEETSNTLDWADRALRVEIDGAGSFSRYTIYLKMDEYPHLEDLRGKTIGFGCHVFTPSGAAYNVNDPRTEVRVVPNGSGAVASTDNNRMWIPGHWGMTAHQVAIPADCTQIDFECWANRSSTNLAGSGYSLFGDFYMWIGGDANLHKVYNGQLVPYPWKTRKRTVTSGDTSPTVGRGTTNLVINNAAPTSITAFDDGTHLQNIEILILDGNTTFVNSSGLHLDNGMNLSPPSGGYLNIFNYSGAWYEKSRTLF